MGKYSSMCSYRRQGMEVNRQLHTPPLLYPAIQTSVRIEWNAECASIVSLEALERRKAGYHFAVLAVTSVFPEKEAGVGLQRSQQFGVFVDTCSHESSHCYADCCALCSPHVNRQCGSIWFAFSLEFPTIIDY
jgi:hypothetical protein